MCPAPFRRTDRIAELIKQELASMLLTEVRDPRVQQVNITSVKVTKDLGIAKVYYLLWNVTDPNAPTSRRARSEAAAGLEKVSAFLRRGLGQRIRLRTTPRLNFYWDEGIEHRRKMDQIFEDLAEERRAAPVGGDDDEA